MSLNPVTRRRERCRETRELMSDHLDDEPPTAARTVLTAVILSVKTRASTKAGSENSACHAAGLASPMLPPSGRKLTLSAPTSAPA